MKIRNIFGIRKKHDKSSNSVCVNDVTQLGFSLKDDDFVDFNSDYGYTIPTVSNAWVNIAVDILKRNIARADFILVREGEQIREGKLYDLFRRPNCELGRYDLWKATSGWWFT
jgi:hypothetical protein